uniref:PGPS/NH22 n=1 Tax=Petunia hybrida TaxID=4102 RepID=Q9ZTM0_PETHY|nr:PGPS/NH22 [Petunia x hybrida]
MTNSQRDIQRAQEIFKEEMGYLRYVLGIQIIYTMCTSTSLSMAMENDSAIAPSSSQDDSEMAPSSSQDDIAMAPSSSQDDSAMAPSSSQDDHIVLCVRDCMRICMKLDDATSTECEEACRTGCRPLLARKEISALHSDDNSSMILTDKNNPTNKPGEFI